MKKILLVFAFVVVLGAVVFYLGWIQIRLPENTYAVIFTKTRGWDATVTAPGTFAWRWERLIPTNLALHKYLVEPQSTSFRYSGRLPNGDLYAELIEPRPSFDYEVAFSISFTLKPEALVTLASEQKITPERLPEYYDRIATSIAATASAVLNSLAADEDFATQLATVSPQVEKLLLDRIGPQFPEVQIHRLLPTTLELPDVDLYRAAKAQFLAIAASREQTLIEHMSTVVKTENRVDQHFGVLERYGDLLSRYPVLLELFTLKGGRLDEILGEIENPETATGQRTDEQS